MYSGWPVEGYVCGQGRNLTSPPLPPALQVVDSEQSSSSSEETPSMSSPTNTCSLASYNGFGSTSSAGEDETEEQSICRWLTGDVECGLQFSSPSLLAKHIDQDHNLTQPVCLWNNCQRRGKVFDARYKLVIHLRCHTGERPYRCSFKSCSRSFSRVENMKLHHRTHTGEKPYVCSSEGCNKRFNNTSDRAKHMKTHIEKKPYLCKFPGCTKRYTDPSSMRKHYRTMHRPGNKALTKSTEQSCMSGNGATSCSKVPVKRHAMEKTLSKLNQLQEVFLQPDDYGTASCSANTSNVRYPNFGCMQSHFYPHGLAFLPSGAASTSWPLTTSAFPLFIPVMAASPVPTSRL